MTPREKAKQLVEQFEDVTFKDSYRGEGGTDYFERELLPEAAKKVALLCINELIEYTNKYKQGILVETDEYLQEVKNEITQMKV